MSTPIYDRLTQGPASPFVKGRAQMFVDGERITTPLTEAAQNAIRDWHADYHDEIAARLAPYGLHPFEVIEPEYRRVVYVDEVTQ